MAAVFWLIVIVGVSLTVRAIVSDRRNPPMRKCGACQGSGVMFLAKTDGLGRLGQPEATRCVYCLGARYVEVTS